MAGHDECHSTRLGLQRSRGEAARVYWANIVIAGLAAGAIYALYGLGITLVYKSTRVPNFAHAGIGGVGAYVFYKSWSGSRHALRIPVLHFQIPWTHVHWNPTIPA